MPGSICGLLRRTQRNLVAAFGLDPSECVYRIVASGPYWSLRDYGNHATSHSSSLSLPRSNAPTFGTFAPSLSAISYCLRGGMNVHHLEWLPASQSSGNNGLDEYALAISECVAKISADSRDAKPFLVGHSLGGTLAAVYSAWTLASIRELVLLCAPLCFEPKQSRFRDALVSRTTDTIRGRTVSRFVLVEAECARLAKHGSFGRG